MHDLRLTRDEPMIHEQTISFSMNTCFIELPPMHSHPDPTSPIPSCPRSDNYQDFNSISSHTATTELKTGRAPVHYVQDALRNHSSARHVIHYTAYGLPTKVITCTPTPAPRATASPRQVHLSN
jgi:hypothetical protein